MAASTLSDIVRIVVFAALGAYLIAGVGVVGFIFFRDCRAKCYGRPKMIRRGGSSRLQAVI